MHMSITYIHIIYNNKYNNEPQNNKIIQKKLYEYDMY